MRLIKLQLSTLFLHRFTLHRLLDSTAHVRAAPVGTAPLWVATTFVKMEMKHTAVMD